MNRSFKKLFILAGAVASVSIALCSSTHAQYRIDTGRTNDANNRIGSGGLNSGGEGTVGRTPYSGVTGNDIVTGNVTAGKEFRGNVPYTDPRAFRGNLPEENSDHFIRDSAGTPYAGISSNNATAVRPFYGDSRGVAPPPGFIRDGYGATGYVPAPIADRSGADLRLGNPLPNDTVLLPQPGQLVLPGPVDPNTNNNTLITASSLYGVRTWNPNNSADQAFVARYSNIYGQNPNQAGLSDVELNSMRNELQTTAGSLPIDMRAQLNNQNLSEQNAQQNATMNLNLAQPLPSPLDSPNNGSLATGQLQSSLAAASPMQGDLNTGEGQQARLLVPAAQQSTANALLQARLDQAQGKKPQNDVDVARQYNKDVMAAKNAQAAKNQQNPAQPNAQQPANDANPNPPSDNAVPGPTNASGERQPPPQIKNFAAGVKAKGLADVLTKAEGLMKEGKWFNAAEQYDIAQQVAPNNMLFAVGRANAELGGSYYGRAEADLRRAFTQDPATLEGTYDLHSLIGDDRLQFLVTDLKDIANKNPSQPRPMFLLAYIAYNTGNERMAAGYLDVAEKRAGTGDTFYSLVRKHWVLPKGDVPAPDVNKP